MLLIQREREREKRNSVTLKSISWEVVMFVHAGQWTLGLQRQGTPYSKLNVDVSGAVEFLKLFTKQVLLNNLGIKVGRLP